MLNTHDSFRTYIPVVDAAPQALGARFSRPAPSSGGGVRPPRLRLGLGGPQNSGRAEHLVRLHQDSEGPLLPSHIGMEHLGLTTIGVANLFQSGVQRNAQDRVRINLEAKRRQSERSSGVGYFGHTAASIMERRGPSVNFEAAIA